MCMTNLTLTTHTTYITCEWDREIRCERDGNVSGSLDYGVGILILKFNYFSDTISYFIINLTVLTHLSLYSTLFNQE